MHAACVLLLVCIGSSRALAQQPPDVGTLGLEELMAVEVNVVYGASRYEQKVQEAPASVTVVTAEQIRVRGYRTLAEILASVPGFYITSDQNYSFLGVRGFARPGDYNSRVLLLVNGHRLNDNIYDQATIGTDFPIDVPLIHRVEIIRGPNSSLYGTSAFLAVVNVLTRTGRDLPGVTLSTEAGSLGTLSGQVTAGLAGKAGPSLLVSASGFSSDGQSRWYDAAFDSPETGYGVAIDADRDRATRFYAALTAGNLTVQAARGDRRKNVPTGAWGTIFGDRRFVTTDVRSYLNAQYVAQVNGFTVTARGHLDSYSYVGDYPYAEGEGTVLNVDSSRGLWWGGEAWVTSAPGRRQRFSLGAEIQRHVRQDQFNGNQGTAPILDDRRDSIDVGLYAQGRRRLAETLAVDASLRYDRRGNRHDTLSPRVAIIHDPTAATTVKAIYGRVFRYPNAYEQFYADLSTQKVNPSLQPETVTTWELLVDHRFGRTWRLAAGGFRSRFRELIDEEVDPIDGLTFFENVASVRAGGLEFEAEANDEDGLAVGRISYSLEWAIDGDTGETLTNAPRHLLKVSLGSRLPWWKLTAGGGIEYTSRRFTQAGAWTEPATLVGLNLERRDLLPGLDASLRIENLLDCRYADPASAAHLSDTLARDGRTFMVRTAYRLGR